MCFAGTMLAPFVCMSRIESYSKDNSGRNETTANAGHSRRSEQRKPWITRSVAAFSVGLGCCAVSGVAHARGPETSNFEIAVQAEGVTPTSQFTGSARFFVPARRRHHPQHQVQPQAPQPLPYYNYAPPPEGYVLKETVNKPLVWSGALLLGIPYMVGLTYAVVDDFPGKTGYLAIPIAGPWLARHEDSSRASRVALGLDGLAQATGAVLLTLGFTLTRKEWVPYHMANMWIVPDVTAQGRVGLSAGGTF